MDKRITAYFRPQADLRSQCIEIDGGYEFDITDQIKEMGLEGALELKDKDEDRDALWRDSDEHGQAQGAHSGPFEVDLDYDKIRAFFA